MPRLVLRALVCAGLLSSLASPVLGHAALESATPGPGDRVTGSPMELVAQFSQDLDPTRTSLEVRDATGARVARGGDPGNTPREFRLDLPELAPGKYEVRWTSSSIEDGEIARDTYTFEVVAVTSTPSSPTPSPRRSVPPAATPAGSPGPTPPASGPLVSPSPGSDTSGTPADLDAWVLIPIVVALAAVGVFGLWALRRPRP